MTVDLLPMTWKNLLDILSRVSAADLDSLVRVRTYPQDIGKPTNWIAHTVIDRGSRRVPCIELHARPEEL